MGSNMQAGAGLDELIAIKVMGWTKRDIYANEVGFLPRYAWDGSIHMVSGMAAFRPSDDIANAWEVIERLRSLGFRYVSLETEEDDLGWFLCWQRTDNRGVGPYADTAPLAICRAALIALSAVAP